MSHKFYDIHCHILPAIDDGSSSWEMTFAMAKLAVADGVAAIVCTPHQLGTNSQNKGDHIRLLVAETQRRLDKRGIALQLLPGADVRIEPEMMSQLRTGEVVSLGDHRKHVLLELPHELYFPIDNVLDSLARQKMIGILSHPERNEGILKDRSVLEPLVENGCQMQITAGSLLGEFGPRPRDFSEWMLREGLVHFLASDAHGLKSRRPGLRKAFERAAEIVGEEEAFNLCSVHPQAVAEGRRTPSGFRPVVHTAKPNWFSRIFLRQAS
ncbi:tyrosine-protein phosphatase [Lignipirellula cremea]|uniref:tyrosine-protein phosphatase n=1 Tax=Lignipirellula cremea TaxID=2528010 RepID=UPI0011A7F772|nr:CpsB/CapC family capsule biosynthesis tyrosine phosphatase [Lignipirellula cremea]